MIDAVFTQGRRCRGRPARSPVRDTVKRWPDNAITEATVPREGLWLAQTPQVFRRDWLVDAYARDASRGRRSPTTPSSSRRPATRSIWCAERSPRTSRSPRRTTSPSPRRSCGPALIEPRVMSQVDVSRHPLVLHLLAPAAGPRHRAARLSCPGARAGPPLALRERDTICG